LLSQFQYLPVSVHSLLPFFPFLQQTLDASPLSCGSGCQTDIHFAISEEYEGGWKVQVAVANTGSLPINNWLLAMDLPLINYLGSVFSVNYATSKQLRKCLVRFFEIEHTLH
jgi:hypothetical protein